MGTTRLNRKKAAMTWRQVAVGLGMSLALYVGVIYGLCQIGH